MTKTRDLANLVSGSNPLVDGVIDYSEITNTPAPFDPDTLAAVAVSGSYADLGGKPALATVATSGSFTDLSNQPAPFDPATLAAVAVSGSFNDLSNQPAPFDPATLASVATTGAYSSLSGTPALATVATTGAYGNLTGTPALAAVATTGAYSSLSGVPALAAVATTGAYSSLSGTPAAALPLTGGTLSGALTLNGALNGVTSVNATTAAAITAAGIGAPFTWNVLATQTDSSQVMAPWTSSNLSVTMPNYSAISHIAIVLTYDLYTTESWNYYFSIYLTDQDYLGQSDGNQYKMQYLHNLGEPANTWVGGNNILMICEISPQFSLTATGNEGPVLEPYNNFETYGVAARGGYSYAQQGYYQLKDSRIAPNGTWTTKVKHYYYGGSGGYTRNRVLKVYARYTL